MALNQSIEGMDYRQVSVLMQKVMESSAKNGSELGDHPKAFHEKKGQPYGTNAVSRNIRMHLSERESSGRIIVIFVEFLRFPGTGFHVRSVLD